MRSASSLVRSIAVASCHVVSRVGSGLAICGDDDDRRRFLGLFSEVPDRFGTGIDAFVLMENRCHILMSCRRADLSRIHAVEISREGAETCPGMSFARDRFALTGQRPGSLPLWASFFEASRQDSFRAGPWIRLSETLRWMQTSCSVRVNRVNMGIGKLASGHWGMADSRRGNEAHLNRAGTESVV